MDHAFSKKYIISLQTVASPDMDRGRSFMDMPGAVLRSHTVASLRKTDWFAWVTVHTWEQETHYPAVLAERADAR